MHKDSDNDNGGSRRGLTTLWTHSTGLEEAWPLAVCRAQFYPVRLAHCGVQRSERSSPHGRLLELLERESTLDRQERCAMKQAREKCEKKNGGQ